MSGLYGVYGVDSERLLRIPLVLITNMSTELKIKAQKLFVPKTIFSVDYNAFEAFIQEVYGVEDYSFVADQEMSNDLTKTFRVDGSELDKWDKKDIERFIAGAGGGFMARVLLQDLCAKGIIEAGTYSINVSW